MMNVEQVVRKAISFANSSGYPWVRVVSVRKVKNRWVVKIDVGVINPDYRTIRIDAKSGEVVGFEK